MIRIGLFNLFKSNVEKMKAERDVEGLIKALKHKGYIVRLVAAWAPGEIGDARAVEPLIQVLNDVFIRGSAEKAIKKIRSKKS